MSRFLCEICSKSFIHNGSLYNHKKRKHSQSQFQCDLCCFCSDSKFSFIRHKKKKHSNISPTNRTTVKCTLCAESCFTKLDLVHHYINCHNISITNETLEFKSEDDFSVWKSQVEKEQACEYIRKHSKYISKVDGTTKITFYCHRNGTFKSKSENKRRLKVLGSNKIDGHCPAKITCSFHTSGKITAIFCKNHVGHKPEIGRMRLSTSDKQTIANKIASEVPLEKILDDIKLSVNTSEIDRIHLVTRKDLLNIKQQYLKSKTFKHKTENIGVESWLKEMKDELQSCIDKDDATKKLKMDLILQFLSVIDKVKTEEDFIIISKHIQSLLPKIEEELSAQLQLSDSNSETTIEQLTLFSNRSYKNSSLSIQKPTNCEKDAIAAILLLEENNCQIEH